MDRRGFFSRLFGGLLAMLTPWKVREVSTAQFRYDVLYGAQIVNPHRLIRIHTDTEYSV
jgi:hypothetical protein